MDYFLLGFAEIMTDILFNCVDFVRIFRLMFYLFGCFRVEISFLYGLMTVNEI